MEAMTAPRMYQGRALARFSELDRSRYYSGSRVAAAIVLAAAVAAGIFLSTLLPYLSNLPR
jgi:hypothetical protein